MPAPIDPPDLSALIASQDGVVARWQAAEHGLRPHDIDKRLRWRTWVRWSPGVYLTHTGVPTWRQRAWAAVLAVWPAALRGRSAVHAAEGAAEDDSTILVAIDRDRCRRSDAPGAQVRRLVDLAERVQWNTRPPRQRYEHAVIEVAATAHDEAAAAAALTRAVSSRRTTAPRLAAALASLRRVPRRDFLADVLDDVAHGVSSVLERAYVERVERAHGLPRSAWQIRAETPAGTVYRDATYEGGAVIELDGIAPTPHPSIVTTTSSATSSTRPTEVPLPVSASAGSSSPPASPPSTSCGSCAPARRDGHPPPVQRGLPRRLCVSSLTYPVRHGRHTPPPGV